MNREELSKLPIETLKQMALEKAEMQSKREELKSLSVDELKNLALEKASQGDSLGGQMQAGLESFGKGATLGYLPHLQAGAKMLVDKFTPESDTDKQLREQGFNIEEDDSYTSTRDSNIKRQQQQAEQYPKTTTAGELAGGVATGIATAGVGAQAKGLSIGAKILHGAKIGATYGALQNPKDIEGKVSGLQLLDRFENAVTGGATGAIVPIVGESLKGVKKAYKGTRNFIKKGAEAQALQAAGAERGSINKVLKSNRIDLDKAGRDLMEPKLELGGKSIVNVGDTIDDISSNIKKMEKSTGSKIGDILEETDDFLDNLDFSELSRKERLQVKNFSIDMRNFKSMMRRYYAKNLSGVDKKTTYNTMMRALNELEEGTKGGNKNLSLKNFAELRKTVDDKITWTKATQDLTPVQAGFKEMRHRMQEITKNKIKLADKFRGTDLLSEFEKANKDFAQYKTLSEFSRNRIASKSNKFFGMSELLSSITGSGLGASAIGGVAGGPLGAITGIGASLASKKWGGAVGARALKRTAEIMEKDPTRLGKFTDVLIKAYDKGEEEFLRSIVNLATNDAEFKEAIKPNNKSSNKRRLSRNNGKKRNLSIWEKKQLEKGKSFNFEKL